MDQREDDHMMTRDDLRHLYLSVAVAEAMSPTGTPLLYQETISTVFAASAEEALEKAKRSSNGEIEYRNGDGELIRWKTQVTGVIEALDDKVQDGKELFARHFENKSAYDSLGWVHFDS